MAENTLQPETSESIRAAMPDAPPPTLWRRLVQRGRREVVVLAILFAVALSALAFLNLAGEVREGETQAFDESIILALRTADDLHNPIGPPWIEQSAVEITALASTPVVILMVIAVFGFLVMDGRPRLAALVVVSVGGGMLVATLLKLGFDRPRPDLVPHIVETYTSSFPSGHATAAAVAYLTLGGILSWSQRRRRMKIYILTVAILITLMIGATRVYLGVHWPTDVLAGWTLGAGWALAWSAIAIVVSRKRHGPAEVE